MNTMYKVYMLGSFAMVGTLSALDMRNPEHAHAIREKSACALVRSRTFSSPLPPRVPTRSLTLMQQEYQESVVKVAQCEGPLPPLHASLRERLRQTLAKQDPQLLFILGQILDSNEKLIADHKKVAAQAEMYRERTLFITNIFLDKVNILATALQQIKDAASLELTKGYSRVMKKIDKQATDALKSM